jgi:tRNA U34 5-carboxymethylaminomethyl modifying GTPase MnmE/TrmE
MEFNKNNKDIKNKRFENEIEPFLDEYQLLMLSMDEEDALMDEIEKLVEKTKDKDELERIINEKYMPLLEKARVKTRDAFDKWMKSIEGELEEAKALMNKLDDLEDYEE